MNKEVVEEYEEVEADGVPARVQIVDILKKNMY